MSQKEMIMIVLLGVVITIIGHYAIKWMDKNEEG